MKNKRNKKLLASILLSMSLISSISNKAANAHYKDEDRGQLNGLAENIYEFTNSKEDAKKDVSKVSENLFSTIKSIYNNRHKRNPNSVLYKSMKKNMHIKDEDLNIDEYTRQYGPDAFKAMAFMAEGFKGGHFTVWDEQTKNAINTLAKAKEVTEQINCCDAWFWALGGTQQDIEECKNKLNSKYDNCSFVIDQDIPRTWFKVDDVNVETKRKILERVLKAYDSNNQILKAYTQGFNFWCAIIIDKFVGCENNDISKETEAQIYYVYETIIDKLYSSFEKILSAEEENKVFTPKTKVVLDNKKIREQLLTEFSLPTKATKYGLTLIDNFIDNHKDLSELMKVNLYCSVNSLMSSSVLGCYHGFDRNLKIKLLDEMIYKDFKNKQTEEIVQNMVNEVCMVIVDNAVNEGAHEIEKDFPCSAYYSTATKYLSSISPSELKFSNDN